MPQAQSSFRGKSPTGFTRISAKLHSKLIAPQSTTVPGGKMGLDLPFCILRPARIFALALHRDAKLNTPKPQSQLLPRVDSRRREEGCSLITTEQRQKMMRPHHFLSPPPIGGCARACHV